MSILGRTRALVIVRDSDHGFYLDGGKAGEILLPTREVPPEVEQGDEVLVFISRDSEDRLVATTRLPYCQAGEFAGLKVLEVHPRLGVFLDWGLTKDLLLPFAEQSKPVKVGERVVVRVIVDPKTDRLIATSKLGRYLDKTPARYEVGQAVPLIILEKTPLGYAVIVDRRHRGLLHENMVHRPLEIGEAVDGYISEVKEGYKIDVSLEPIGFGRVADLSDRILDALHENGGRLDLGDGSSPEAIRERFGSSKKAFKQAVGTLYRKRLITPHPEYIELLSVPRD